MRCTVIVASYISHKRSLGHRFQTEEHLLLAFCKSVEDEPLATIGQEAVSSFLNGRGPITDFWTKKYHVLSGFYRFALRRDMVKASPLPRTIPKLTVPAFVPYIYSHQELKRLLDAVPAACSNFAAVDEKGLRTFILLLYGAGLRMGEALALTMSDVDLPGACLHIRETKFFKSRLVPTGKDLTKVLSDYIKTTHDGVSPPDAPLFRSRNGSALSKSAARSAFRRMRSYAGVRREGGANRQPRLHDLRHTAAVHRLIAWYQSGADLQDLLPKLAVYLGHVDLSSTQHYLTLTPDLLREASLRFEQYALGGDHD
jgi:integrase